MIMQFNIGHLTQNIVLPWKNMSVNYSHADGFFCVSKVGVHMVFMLCVQRLSAVRTLVLRVGHHFMPSYQFRIQLLFLPEHFKEIWTSVEKRKWNWMKPLPWDAQIQKRGSLFLFLDYKPYFFTSLDIAFSFAYIKLISFQVDASYISKNKY